jgi:hypothetical protein
MVIVVGILNLILVRWSRSVGLNTEGEAYLKVVYSVLGLTWLFSFVMFVVPKLGLVEMAAYVGWDLVSVTGTAIVGYWLLRLQIGIWAKKIDL